VEKEDGNYTERGKYKGENDKTTELEKKERQILVGQGVGVLSNGGNTKKGLWGQIFTEEGEKKGLHRGV